MNKVRKSDEKWRTRLAPMEYAVTRRKATERAFSGRYRDHHEAGNYRCVGCGTALFASDAKCDSGCGWPSYFAPTDTANVREAPDHSHGVIILRSVCDAHLGHVFEDGPPASGLRYCINSAALTFEPHTPIAPREPA